MISCDLNFFQRFSFDPDADQLGQGSNLELLDDRSVLFVMLIGAAVFWAISSGQYDDLEREGEDILLDDDDVSSEHAGVSPIAWDKDTKSCFYPTSMLN